MILKASCRLRPDGPDVLNETVYEFYGCKFHGCHKCYNQGQHLYNTTMERENTLKAAGSKLISIWECECYGMKTHMSSTKKTKNYNVKLIMNIVLLEIIYLVVELKLFKHMLNVWTVELLNVM